MPKFKVTLERMAIMIRTVNAEGDSLEEAQQNAIDDDGVGNYYDYGFVDFDDGPPKAIDT